MTKTVTGVACPACGGQTWEEYRERNLATGVLAERMFCTTCSQNFSMDKYQALLCAPKPKNHFVIMTTFGLNLALATHKTIAELQKEISTEAFLDCDNALVRCALIVAIMPQPAPGDAKQQATEILHGMPTEGVKAQ